MDSRSVGERSVLCIPDFDGHLDGRSTKDYPGRRNGSGPAEDDDDHAAHLLFHDAQSSVGTYGLHVCQHADGNSPTVHHHWSTLSTEGRGGNARAGKGLSDE